MDFAKLSQNDLSKAIGVTSRTIRTWPNVPRNEDKTYSLPKVVAWLVSRAEDASGSAAPDPEAQQWLAKFRRERFKLAKLERLQEEGKLVPIEAISEAWTARIKAVVTGLTFLQNRLPPLLEGKGRDTMYDIIEEEVRSLREWYCRPGALCGETDPAVDAGKK